MNPAPSIDPVPRIPALQRGAERLALVHRAQALRDGGFTLAQAAEAVGLSVATLHRALQRIDGTPAGAATAADLAPRHYRSGRRPARPLTAAEVEAIRARRLDSNRTRTDGSTPAALRAVIRESKVGDDLASAVAQRLETGRAPLTPAQADQVRVSPLAARARRAPRNAWLDNVSSPGSLQLTIDQESGLQRLIQPGEWWTIDDATINFPVTVPLERRGDPCWDRWGVCLGRFQWLVVADHRSYFVPSHTYTCRPKSSYRAEDLVAALHLAFTRHGLPKGIFLERGISGAKIIHHMLDGLGVQYTHVPSPHRKVVESIFNTLWTELSLIMPEAQVGRFRGEEEEINRLMERCRGGALDPRTVFPTLEHALQALVAAVNQANHRTIESTRYGRWVPETIWRAEAHRMLRPMPEDAAWLFNPTVLGPVTVRGYAVKSTVRLAPGWSTEMVWSAPWLHDWHGAKVRLHCNPLDPQAECSAMAVLAETYRGTQAGHVLGRLDQVDAMARLTRRGLLYGADPDIGLDACRANAQALRRVGMVHGEQGAGSVEQGAGSKEQGAKTQASITHLPPAAVVVDESRGGTQAPAADGQSKPDPRLEYDDWSCAAAAG